MSRQSGWWTVAAATTLFVAGSSQADLLGLDAQLIGVDHITGDNAPAGSHYTIDVFAIMEAGDRLDAVAGDATTQKMVSTTPDGQFWQNLAGGNSSLNINPALFGVFASLPYDSFITIGLLDNAGNALATQGMDFANFEVGGAIISNNGAWFITPDDAQGASELQSFGCGDGYAVRIARLTVLGHDTDIHVEGLLQGKDSFGGTITLSATLDVDLGSLQFEDCNNNSIDDSCDIADGTSQDTDENGIPDECQTYDCNKNGTDDGDDIANGTSEDCNSNGIPDECDIADGTSSDCDSNGTPDDCQANDCNGNGTPDNCDIADATSEDCDEDGTPDECELDSDGDGTIDDCEVPPNYTNLETGDEYDTFAAAIAGANDNDRINGIASAVSTELVMNFNGKCVDFNVVDGNTAMTADITLAGCGSFNFDVSDGGSDHLYLNGRLYSGVSGTSRMTAMDFGGNSKAIFVEETYVRSGATLEFLTGPDTATFSNFLYLRSQSTLSGWEMSNSGTCFMGLDSTIEGLAFGNVGVMHARGTVFSELDNQNDGVINCIDDILHVGNLNNDGTINIYRGVYTLVGDLSNNGTINGDIDQGPGLRAGDEAQPGDGFSVSGNYTAGSEARLTMPHEYWAVRIGGHVNLAINDHSNHHMSLAEIHATGRSGSVQNIEVMGSDLGNGTDGLEQGVAGNYPLGTLRIDAASTSNLVDNHDNDNKKQADGEALYCNVLIVDGHLETNGYKVYANEIIINGSVSNNDDVIIIVDGIFGDINSDGEVNVLDLLRVIADWGQAGGDADLNEDGIVDILDFLLVLQEWS